LQVATPMDFYTAARSETGRWLEVIGDNHPRQIVVVQTDHLNHKTLGIYDLNVLLQIGYLNEQRLLSVSTLQTSQGYPVLSSRDYFLL